MHPLVKNLLHISIVEKKAEWPYGVAGVSLDKGLSETRTLSVIDSGEYISYLVDGKRYLK